MAIPQHTPPSEPPLPLSTGLMVVIGHLEHLGALHALVALLDPPAPQHPARPAAARSSEGVDVLWRVCVVAGVLSAAVTNDTACLVRPHTLAVGGLRDKGRERATDETWRDRGGQKEGRQNGGPRPYAAACCAAGWAGACGGMARGVCWRPMRPAQRPARTGLGAAGPGKCAAGQGTSGHVQRI